MIIVTHAGSKGRRLRCMGVPPNSSTRWGTKSRSKKTPSISPRRSDPEIISTVTLAASYHITAKWPEGFLLIVACFNIPPERVQKQRNMFHPVILPYRYAKHNIYKAVSIQIIGTIMCGMVKEFWNILKPSSGLCYHGIIHTKKYRLCCQWIRYHSQSNFSCDIHKVGIINFCIGTCVVKGIEGFCGNPRPKVLI